MLCPPCHFFWKLKIKNMEKKHRGLLRKNRITLVQDLEPRDILGFLFQQEIISDNDMERIKSEKTRTAQAELLLDTLPRRGPRAFDVFCDTLYKLDGQRHLALALKTNISDLGPNVVIPSGGVSEHSDSGTYAREPLRPVQVREPQYDDKTPLPAQSGSPVNSGSGNDDEIYLMNSKPHGHCLIVNNVNFTAGLNNRSGSDVDAQNLQTQFVSLQYKVKVVRNLSSHQLKDTLFSFARQEEHRRCDSVVICILSHGLEGKIYGTDGILVPISELISMFNGNQAKYLVGKPKLFFIQACRGGDYDHGVADSDVTDSAGSIETTEKVLDNIYHDHYDEPDSFVDQSSLPSEADFLVAYSTVPGYVSWRHSKNGSWFIQALVDVLKTHSKCEDLVSMLIKVNGKVARDFESNNKKKQIPSPVVMLTKKLYFFAQH